jgi:hypothetical protein
VSKHKRVAIFHHSETPREGYVPVAVGEGLVAYVKGEALPAGHNLYPDAMDDALLLYDVGEIKRGENFMNAHYVSAKEQRAAVYIAVRGGVVQGVRYLAGVGLPEVRLVDYDNNDRDMRIRETAFERECLDGKTWDEIEKFTQGIF